MRLHPVEDDGVGLVFRRPVEAVELLFVGQTCVQPCHDALVQALRTLRSGYGSVAASFHVGRACLNRRRNVFLLGTTLID